MNRKQFIILLAFVVIIGTAGWLVHQRNRSSWQNDSAAIGQKLLPRLAVNDIAQITIKSGAGDLNLARRDHLWRVRERGDYPANFSQISELLMKLADLKVAQSEEIGPLQLGRFELLPPGPAANAGTLVELKDASGQLLNSVLLGKKHLKQQAGNSPLPGMGDEGWPDGRYVLVGTGARNLAVISDPLDNVQPRPEQWLNKDFLAVEKPRMIAVQFPEATNSWQLTRASETNDWQLVGATSEEQLDSAKVSGVTSPLSSAAFSDVAALNTSNSPVGTTLTVETFDGFTYVARIGPNVNGNYPVAFAINADLAASRMVATNEPAADKARLDQEFKARQQQLADKLAREKVFEGWLYLLPAYSLDSQLKPKSQLLLEAKKATPAAAGK